MVKSKRKEKHITSVFIKKYKLKYDIPLFLWVTKMENHTTKETKYKGENNKLPGGKNGWDSKCD